MTDARRPDAREPSFEAPQVAIGTRLRAAREALGLDIAQASARLNILPRYLEALEEENFSALPGKAFARGYLRSYARLLDLDGNALVAAFNAHSGSSNDGAAVSPVSRIRPQASVSDPLIRLGGWVLLIALVALSIWWWREQMVPAELESPPEAEISAETATAEPFQSAPGTEPPSQDEITAAPEPGAQTLNPPAAEEPVQLSSEADTDAEAETFTTQSSSASETLTATPSAASAALPAEASAPGTSVARTITEETSTEQNSTIQSSTEQTSTEQTSTEGNRAADSETARARLLLAFSGNCWVALRNAEGRTLVARVLEAGEVIDLDLLVPAELVLGRVNAVSEARFNGAELDLESQSEQNVARLRLAL